MIFPSDQSPAQFPDKRTPGRAKVKSKTEALACAWCSDSMRRTGPAIADLSQLFSTTLSRKKPRGGTPPVWPMAATKWVVVWTSS